MKHLLATASLVAMAACTTNGDIYRSYFSEAGALVDSGGFGNANMNNIQVMSGEKGYVYDLANRFSQEVPSTVNFAFNSAALDAGARDTLNEQAAWIRQFPEVRFRVYGHTDKVGSPGYNKQLGLRRAHAAVNYLVAQGISRSRLEAVASYGETQPLIVTQGRERRNRRTVTEVTGFVSSHPTVMDGNYARVIYREYVKSAAPKSTLIMTGGAELSPE
ncbi:outer membrane protein OmpA-like peptidoglycan-associated protein [Roseovarius halotolerans]|uniref:Outer membrane lipoprotein Omp16 n=1 Tax=Roseovarius halotolerans TaxID=505353 RepID=A0A1X6ZMG5_9RHOB|nr:OmpA family protein [Roseovarius halotolerans]RKT28216.1 outer membrane protein OmpA-like peptidoglycan-associated protein [Roseovarius halotolerans]SLN55612.1 Outer membrane lipoprotein Omp16 precursor [Roseovarius halotolerans]